VKSGDYRPLFHGERSLSHPGVNLCGMGSEIDVRIAATAARQHSVFSRDQAKEVGFTRDLIRYRVKSGRWDRLTRDVFRMAGARPTWRQRVMAAVLEAGPDSVASHRTAAALLGIPGFGEGPVEVTHPECRDTRVALSILHQSSLLPPEHVMVIDGIPCTTLPRTLFDLARTEPEARVVRAVKTARRRLGLTIGRLEAVVAALGKSGRGGTRVMRELLDELDADDYVPTESELEDLVLAVLDAFGVPRPGGQVTLGDDRPVGRVDFLYRREKVVIEAQSKRHHEDWEAQVADMDRRAELVAMGCRIVEVTWWQLVHEPERFVSRLRRALAVAAAA
jgi:hypothetical protein